MKEVAATEKAPGTLVGWRDLNILFRLGTYLFRSSESTS